MINIEKIPNLITFLRFFLTIPIIIAILKSFYLLAFILFILASITDALDGWIAKKHKCQTSFGSKIDPLADKILLISCFAALFYNELIPLWLLIIIIIRDMILIVGAIFFIIIQ